MSKQDKITTRRDAYKAGMQSALEDWTLSGPPHRTRKPPSGLGLEKRGQWFLGRVHGFHEADAIIHKESTENTPEKP